MGLEELGERTWPAEVPITQNAWEIRFCLFPGTDAMCVWLRVVVLIFPTCSHLFSNSIVNITALCKNTNVKFYWIGSFQVNAVNSHRS